MADYNASGLVDTAVMLTPAPVTVAYSTPTLNRESVGHTATLPNHTSVQSLGNCGPPTAGPSIRAVTASMTYVNLLKRIAGQAGNDDGEGQSNGQNKEDGENEGDQEDEEDQEVVVLIAPPRPTLFSGPIKGFSTNRVLENLNPVVHKAWASQAEKVVFIHYLDGGYGPNITQNVHVSAFAIHLENHIKIPKSSHPTHNYHVHNPQDIMNTHQEQENTFFHSSKIQYCYNYGDLVLQIESIVIKIENLTLV